MKNRNHIKIILSLLFIACVPVFLISSCKKDDNNDIAQYYVDFTLYLNEPSNIALNAVGGWVYVNEGTKGIIVYRRSLSEFTALERNCPYDPTAACSIVQIVSGITAIDSCCSSRFSIYDGSVINGPATKSMYQYKTYYDGVILRVFN